MYASSKIIFKDNELLLSIVTIIMLLLLSLLSELLLLGLPFKLRVDGRGYYTAYTMAYAYEYGYLFAYTLVTLRRPIFLSCLFSLTSKSEIKLLWRRRRQWRPPREIFLVFLGR